MEGGKLSEGHHALDTKVWLHWVQAWYTQQMQIPEITDYTFYFIFVNLVRGVDALFKDMLIHDITFS